MAMSEKWLKIPRTFKLKLRNKDRTDILLLFLSNKITLLKYNVVTPIIPIQTIYTYLSLMATERQDCILNTFDL